MAGTLVDQRDGEVVVAEQAEDGRTGEPISKAVLIDNPFRRPAHRRWYGRKATRRLVALVILGLIGANVWAFREVANRTDPISVADALTAYRANHVTGPSAAAAPNGTIAGLAADVPTATTLAPSAAPAAAIAAAGTVAGATPAGASTGPTAGAGAGVPAAGPAADDHAGLPGATVAAPEPGVYVYDTAGKEDVSALGGSTHAYPAQTTITVDRTACGWDIDWAPLQQRSERSSLCRSGDSLELTAFVMHHEFFGKADDHSFTCTGTWFRPAAATAGASVGPGHCTSGDAAVDFTTTVVGTESRTVGGASVPAVHVHLQGAMSGSSVGTKTFDLWMAADSGLLLRVEATVESDSDTVIGPTHYSERYTLDLTSLKPLS